MLLMRPKVTLGVCVKNSEATIKKAMESIINQDFPHELMELIVVDGYSQDKTLSIIKEYLSKVNIKRKIFHENRGLGPARQIVVENASGDYIMWVDGDLMLPKDYVRKQVEFMECNPTVGIAGGKYGMLPETKFVAALENIAYVVIGFKNRGRADSKGPGAGGSIYRAEAIKQVKGFDKQIGGAGEDVDAACRVRAAGWLLHRTQAVFYERCRETWKSHWNQYIWWGYGAHFIHHKHGGLFPLWQIMPPVAFLTTLLRSSLAYRLTHRKAVVLWPFQCFFKMTAYCLGFVKGHMDGYGHIYY